MIAEGNTSITLRGHCTISQAEMQAFDIFSESQVSINANLAYSCCPEETELLPGLDGIQDMKGTRMQMNWLDKVQRHS